MRFNLRWLLEYLETDLEYADLLNAITMAGHEVEEALDLGFGDGGLVVGEIVELTSHPNADKLSLCKVNAGGAEPLQIVCGATNIEVGQKVPLAKVGYTLPNGFTLKPAKIRGSESFGMMCSAKELGVAEDHAGIWIQPDSLKVGQPFDAIIEIGVTPNRPDGLSLVGLARDVAAKSGGKLKLPEVKFVEAHTKVDSAARVTVEPEAREDCPRYAARVINNVKIAESPIWLKRKLESAGLRPINNIVDVTNFVMLELGHPLHAFDLDTLAKRSVVVRHAREGEKMRLLDDTTVQLEPTDLLIADAENPIALAGIMGGGDSEISDSTTNVLLEAAYFKPSTIRRTSKRLDKSTDSSYRFERGTDPKKLVVALHRAAQLIAELSGGEVLNGHIDVMNALPQNEPMTLKIDYFRTLSGLDLTGRQMSDILTKLGFEIHRALEDALNVTAPSHRPDIHGPADLVEEITRIHGYDKIPTELPNLGFSTRADESHVRMERRLVDIMLSLGLTQAVNFSFVSEGANAAAGVSDPERNIRVLNPLQEDQAFMRRSLIPSMLECVAHNFNHQVEPVKLFEIGRTYAWKDAEYDEEADLEDPKTLDPATEEKLWLCATLTGESQPDWRAPKREYDFYDIKGVAQGLLDGLGITKYTIEPVTDAGLFHPGRCAAFVRGGERLVWFGELHPAVAKELDLKRRVFLLEAPISGALLELVESPKYQEIPRYPAITRDLALVVDRAARALDLERAIRSGGRELLEDVHLFDLYEGKHVAENEKSIAFTMTFRHPERTLKDEEVNEAIARITKTLEDKHGARLRG